MQFENRESKKMSKLKKKEKKEDKTNETIDDVVLKIREFNETQGDGFQPQR